jgi:hypothetical protein
MKIKSVISNGPGRLFPAHYPGARKMPSVVSSTTCRQLGNDSSALMRSP